jgi:hypothetical protein
MSRIYVEAEVRLSDVLSEISVKDLAAEFADWDEKDKAELRVALAFSSPVLDDDEIVERLRAAAKAGDLREVRRLIDIGWPEFLDTPEVIASRYKAWKQGKYVP